MTLRFAPDRIEQWPVERLAPSSRNPRTHSAEQVAQIAASIVEFGWSSPILAAGDGAVIAGHGRLEAARKLGLATVPVIVLDHLTPAQRRAYIIADNQLALNAGWDEALLASELHALNGMSFDLSLTGFDEAELDRLMAPLDDASASDENTSDDTADEVAEAPRDPISRPGDLWRLGEHRLLCADSTDPTSVARVMDGGRAVLVFTSPPYGNQRDYTTGGVEDWDGLMRGVFARLPLSEDAQVLVNLGLIHRDNEWQIYWHAWLDWMREQVIEAVVAILAAALPGAEVKRNLTKPERIPLGGLVIVRDGDPGEPEVTLSPLTFIYSHRIPVEIAVHETGSSPREHVLDEMLGAIGAAVANNRTLGGLCDFLEAEAPATADIETAGALPGRWADMAVVAHYGTTDPLN